MLLIWLTFTLLTRNSTELIMLCWVLTEVAKNPTKFSLLQIAGEASNTCLFCSTLSYCMKWYTILLLCIKYVIVSPCYQWGLLGHSFHLVEWRSCLNVSSTPGHKQVIVHCWYHILLELREYYANIAGWTIL